jgi:uroporphyrinogen decarboxylase
MNSREIVKATLEFNYPERVARTFKESDMVLTSVSIKTGATEWYKVEGNMEERVDAWGNVWRRTESVSKGEIFRGAIKSIDDLDLYQFPDNSKEEYYRIIKEDRQVHNNKWMAAVLPGFTFVIARDLFRLEEYLVSLKLEYETVRRFHDRIDDYLEKQIVNYGKTGADSIFFGEDWGTQTQTLISPDLWYQEFYPRFKRLCGTAHDCGMKVFMHSCGAIKAIIPGLIKAGIDLFQFDQPEVHGIDLLASFQEYHAITYWSPVDIQKTLQEKDESVIRAKVREMLDKLWRGRGGFIAKIYGGNAAIGLDPVWQEYAADEFVNCGKSERYLK